METMNTSKLIDYIDGAKDWLDKAKTEYNQANPVGGELILNLAQAEIKYAWELSRSNYVSDSMKPVRKRPVRNPERKFKLILPVAASIIIIVAVFGWWLTAGIHPVKNRAALTGNTGSGIKEKVIEPVRNQNMNLTEKSSPPMDNNINGQLALENQSEPVKTEPFTSLATGRTDRTRQSVENTTRTNQTRLKENSAGQPNMQPVSKLVIDEEALAREASYSLRNGK